MIELCDLCGFFSVLTPYDSRRGSIWEGVEREGERGGKEKRDRGDEMRLWRVTIIEHSDIFVAYNEVKRLSDMSVHSFLYNMSIYHHCHL